MYRITKTIEVSGAHRLELPYISKCCKMHGHNWIIKIHCQSEQLNGNGMVEDFSIIHQTITEVLDHKCLNDVFDFNPTAENIAAWICKQIPTCYRVDVQESEGNTASYEKE